MRADPSGVSLTAKDAAVIKAMLARGDRQHDVAAWFGVNGGRIAEIVTGQKHTQVKPAKGTLPPPGPYPAARKAVEAIAALKSASRAIKVALTAIQKVEGATIEEDQERPGTKKAAVPVRSLRGAPSRNATGAPQRP